MSSMVGDMFSGIANLIRSGKEAKAGNTTPQQPTNDDYKSTLKNLETVFKDYTWVYENGEFWGAGKDGTIVRGKSFDEIQKKIAALNNKKATATTTPQEEPPVDESKIKQVPSQTTTVRDLSDAEGDKDKFRINTIKGGTTYEVKKGNTWYGIVTANYDTSNLSGSEIKELAYALAAANSGQEDPTAAMAAAKKGIYFKVGDNIKLPNTLQVGDKTIKLNETIKDAATQDYKFATGGTFAVSVKSVGDKYQLVINGETQPKLYDTREAAKAAAPEGAEEEQ